MPCSAPVASGRSCRSASAEGRASPCASSAPSGYDEREMPPGRAAPMIGAPSHGAFMKSFLLSRPVRATVHWLALLALCAAYLQGGFNKATDFAGAVAEMQHFGLAPAAALALAVIVLEIGASLLILSGVYRWAGALALAAFTLSATFVANRFWELAQPERFMAANAFFEHLGLVGAFVLVAWHDLKPAQEQ